MKLSLKMIATFALVIVIGVAPVHAMSIQIAGADDLHIDALSAVLMDKNTGIVMYDRNMHERRYPASMTKVMTALLVLESFHDNLEARVHFSHEAVFSIDRNSSHIAMNDNETLSVLEALYAIMLPSANEVSNALAELVAGDMDSFATLMTARAIELGAVNTRFVNAHGLHDPNHFTTAYDMALIMKEAMRFPVLHQIIGTTFTELPPTERQPESRPLLNTNRMIVPASAYFNPYVVGGKTGFTDEAGHTLVTYAAMLNTELISVVMGLGRAGTFSETNTLLNFGFNNFENVLIFDRHSYTREIPVLGTSGTVRALGERTLTLSLPRGVSQFIDPTEFDIPPYLEAVSDGDLIGTATIRYGGIVLGSIPMFADTPVNFMPEVFVAQELPDDFSETGIAWILTWLWRIVLGIAICLVTLISLLLVTRSRRRRRQRYRMAQLRRKRRPNSYQYRYRYKN